MNKPMDSPKGSLASLAIQHHQRPGSSRRAWIPLAVMIGAVVVAAAAGGWWYYRTTGRNIMTALVKPPTEVSLLVVEVMEEGAPSTVLVANGEIVSDLQVKIATKVSGQIVELNVEQGDVVQSGAVLARIEDVLYRARRDEAAAGVQRRRFEVARARSELTRAKAAIDQRRADCDFEKRNYERLQPLHANGQVGDWEFYNAKNKYESAAAALEQATAALDSAEAAVQAAESERLAAEAVLALTQKQLDDCAITAPISGVVLERNAQLGDFLAAEGGRGANANAQLVEIADMNLLRVEVDVSERDVHRLHAGQPARITPDANRDAVHNGKILWIDPIGDYAKATVEVKVRLLDPGPSLRVGGSAKVEFLSEASGAVASARPRESNWLPKAAVKLTPGSDKATVFTVADGLAVAHAVDIGARTDNAVEIRSGVAAGMKIIAENADSIEDGEAVKVVKTLLGNQL